MIRIIRVTSFVLLRDRGQRITAKYRPNMMSSNSGRCTDLEGDCSAMTAGSSGRGEKTSSSLTTAGDRCAPLDDAAAAAAPSSGDARTNRPALTERRLWRFCCSDIDDDDDGVESTTANRHMFVHLPTIASKYMSCTFIYR